MRIAIDARMYGNEQCTGIGTYIERLTNELFKIDKKNEYLLFLKEPAFTRFSPPHDGVKKALVTPRWYSYEEQYLLPFEMNREKFDLMHYPHFNSPLLYFKKSICTIHDITPLFFPGHKMNSLFRRMAHKLVFNSTIKKASQIIAVSESTKQGIIEHFQVDPEKIKVTYEGVDERFKFTANNDTIKEVKERLGIIKPYLFYVGVWRNHKNIETLVKAFDFAREKHNLDLQLVLGGREDLHYTNVRTEIERSKYKKDIITTGFIADNELPLLYSSALAFVIPSFIEGFGLIAIEAQNCNCPVLAANTSCLPEVLSDSALFFNPKNFEELAKRIEQIATSLSLRQDLIIKGQKNCTRFSWKKCAEQTLQIYNSL